MSLTFEAWRKVIVSCVIAFLLFETSRTVQAKGDVILHAFARTDGWDPQSTLLVDPSGNLYGTTVEGGVDCRRHGCGIVFELAPNGDETILHAFLGKQNGDGSGPSGGLVNDKTGSFYGATVIGGRNCLRGDISGGCGVIYKIGPDNSEQLLHVFKGGERGEFPYSKLIIDRHGNLYGTTFSGGNTGCGAGLGCGTIFKLSKDWKLITLYTFSGGSDGGPPSSGLIVDGAGNFYGETSQGGNDGCSGYGCGTVFKLAPDGTYSVLYAFLGGTDGATPGGGLVADDAGNLYGTTANGGDSWGTVFKLGSDGSETVLHAFTLGDDGGAPSGALIRDRAGNLFGTTYVGGGSGCDSQGCGTVFRVTADGAETVLYTFEGGIDGSFPIGGLVAGKGGTLYGTTSQGGGGTACGNTGCGTVFQLRK